MFVKFCWEYADRLRRTADAVASRSGESDNSRAENDHAVFAHDWGPNARSLERSRGSAEADIELRRVGCDHLRTANDQASLVRG